MIEIKAMPGGRAVATLANYLCGTWRSVACGRAVARGILQGQDHHHRARPSARRLLRSLCSARRRSSEAIHSGQSEHHRAASAGRRRRGGGALVPRAGAARRHHHRPVRRDHRPHAAPDAGAGPVEGRGDDLYRHVHAEQRRLRHPQERAHDHRRRRCARRAVTVACTGVNSQSYQYPASLKELGGFKFIIVCGYPGSAEVMLAIHRAEADMFSGSWHVWRATQQAGLKDGSLIPVIQGGLKRTQDLPDVPLMQELVRRSAEKEDHRVHFRGLGDRTRADRAVGCAGRPDRGVAHGVRPARAGSGLPGRRRQAVGRSRAGARRRWCKAIATPSRKRRRTSSKRRRWRWRRKRRDRISRWRSATRRAPPLPPRS